MNFKVLDKEAFGAFAVTHPCKNFLQTKEMADVIEKDGNQVYFVGVTKQDKIIAASMIKRIKGRRKDVFYAPRGLLVDYENQELLQFFCQALKQFVKENGGYVLRIDPYYELQEEDIDGNKVKGGFSHQTVITSLLKLGFIPQQDYYQQFKYMFCLSLDKDKESLLQSFHTRPKRMIKKAMANEITVSEITDKASLAIISDLIKETGKRKQFQARDLSYYEHLYDAFSPSKKVKFMIATLNTKLLIKKKEQELEQLEHKNLEKAAKLQQDIEQLQQMPCNEDGTIVLSCGVFMLYGEEVVYLFGGNRNEYLHFGSSYFLQWTMIQYALEHGFQRYNFYGFQSPTKDDGVYLFKRGFQGQVVELIGDFALPVTPYYYLHSFFRRLKP